MLSSPFSSMTAATRLVGCCICSCFAFRQQPNGLAGDMAHWLWAERPPFQDRSAEEQQNRGLVRPVMAWQCGDNLISELALCNKKMEDKKRQITTAKVRGCGLHLSDSFHIILLSMSPGSWEIQPARATAHPSAYPLQQTTSGNTPVFSPHSFHFCAQHKHFASDILVPLTILLRRWVSKGET